MNLESLKGLWAAVPTPWSEDGRFAPETLARNIERYAEIPMDGVYTTDSDGEFYAIELLEFKQLAKTFSESMEGSGMAAAMGATWCNTQGVIDRMKAGMDNGIEVFHVAFPFWMPLAPSDEPKFWEDLAGSVPNAKWIHYNTPRGHRTLDGKAYEELARRHPDQFVGTKLGSAHMLEIVDCIEGAPDRIHLATDYATVPAMMLGAKGVCSYWANTLPRWTRRLVDLCFAEKWGEAMAMQKRLLVWEARHTAPLRRAGYLHGIIGKARGALTGFLEDSGVTRPPYHAVGSELQAEFQKAFDSYWKGET